MALIHSGRRQQLSSRHADLAEAACGEVRATLCMPSRLLPDTSAEGESSPLPYGANSRPAPHIRRVASPERR